MTDKLSFYELFGDLRRSGAVAEIPDGQAAALLKYGRHFPHCHEIKGRGECTCGFAQALEEVSSDAGEVHS